MGTKKYLSQYSVLKEVYSFIVVPNNFPVPEMVERRGLKKEGLVKPIPPNWLWHIQLHSYAPNIASNHAKNKLDWINF